jgi:electron transport complex protein RnfC
MADIATFKRGIHPEYQKELSSGKSIKVSKLPQRVVIPLSQHIGAPAKAEVNIGDEVKRGQVIGSPASFVSAPVHASISGKVVAISDFPHPSGKTAPSIVIESDGKDEDIPLTENADYMNLSADEMKALIKNAGIVGLGGAAFPTNVKLSPPKEKPIDTVILNGAECEPYLTADHRLMMEYSQEIVEGLKIIMKTLNVNQGYIGIEANKPDAIEKIRSVIAKVPSGRREDADKGYQGQGSAEQRASHGYWRCCS